MQSEPQIASDPDSINSLNVDCLVSIFKCLTKSERLAIQSVCKHWKDVSKLAWDNVKELDLAEAFSSSLALKRLDFPQNCNQYAIELMNRCGRYLNKLRASDPCTYEILPHIGQHCSNLRILELDFSYYNKTSTKVFASLQKLKCLRIWGIKQRFPEDILLDTPLENLTEMYLSARTMFGLDEDDYVCLPSVVPKVLSNIETLQTLRLEEFKLESDMMKIIGKQKDLVYLALNNCKIPHLFNVQELRNLEHLELLLAYEERHQLSDQFLVQIAETCKRLKFLDLTGPHTITNFGIRQLEKLTLLEELVLDYSDLYIDFRHMNLQNLKKIHCNSCEFLTNDGMINLIKHARKLEYLNITNTNVTNRLLNEASEIVNKRTNGLKLQLVVNRDVKNKRSKEENSSLRLVVDENDSDPIIILLLFHICSLYNYLPLNEYEYALFIYWFTLIFSLIFVEEHVNPEGAKFVAKVIMPLALCISCLANPTSSRRTATPIIWFITIIFPLHYRNMWFRYCISINNNPSERYTYYTALVVCAVMCATWLMICESYCILSIHSETNEINNTSHIFSDFLLEITNTVHNSVN